MSGIALLSSRLTTIYVLARSKDPASDTTAEWDMKEFEGMVRSLDRSRFWRLRSNRYVEAVLIGAARNCYVQQHLLYTKEPSPFIIDDLSELWWARASWALLFHLLDDIRGVFMIHGEKRGLDSCHGTGVSS
ncbi:MAG: hypothetical protein J3Q66DRAFT_392954 [Benniella sp.]|nr:MAG: hypothetical protein J3Q66DRAFT_392954 [Benniella sp.]